MRIGQQNQLFRAQEIAAVRAEGNYGGGVPRFPTKRVLMESV